MRHSPASFQHVYDTVHYPFKFLCQYSATCVRLSSGLHENATRDYLPKFIRSRLVWNLRIPFWHVNTLIRSVNLAWNIHTFHSKKHPQKKSCGIFHFNCIKEKKSKLIALKWIRLKKHSRCFFVAFHWEFFIF